MRYRFMKEHETQFRTGTMCEVFLVSRSGYYSFRNRPESERAKGNDALLLKIKDAHKKSRKIYGSPRIHEQLLKDGVPCSRGRVARLMRSHGIRAIQKKKFVVTTDSKHDLPVAENVLDRQFDVDTLNTVWTADITYIPTGEGWLYLSAVMDLCSKGIAGWSMDERMKTDLVQGALTMAYGRRNPGVGLLHHSDRGSQYASEDYQNLLKKYGMQASMSRKGNCWDNAPMESFFHTLKTELTHHKKYQTREEARRDIFEYIEVFYNRQRLHSSLGYKSPAEFESEFQPAAYAA
jgi:transposase InsO family protein